MPNLSSLNVVYDLSVKQFEFIDRSYDSLTSRAAALIGWTSFVSSIAIFVQGKLDEMWPWKLVFGICVLALAGMGLVSALCAYFAKEVESWPHALQVYEGYAEKPEDETKLQLVADIESAIRKNTKLVNEKSRHVVRAIKCLASLSLVLLICLFSSFVLSKSEIPGQYANGQSQTVCRCISR